jgi:dihydrodipicolinate synthase/N-acetylneuraminate lyase
VTLTIEVLQELAKIPSIIGMKDSHRDTLTFMRLQKIVEGRISVFCNQLQYVPYAELGARGLWSIDAWMGPWPLFALRDAVVRKDWAAAKDIILDIGPKGTRKTDLSWRETASKIAIRFAGYVDPGPLRPPFLEIPEAVLEAQRKKAEDWKKLCAKYAPAYAG